jgi:hypothetical protein
MCGIGPDEMGFLAAGVAALIFTVGFALHYILRRPRDADPDE